MSLRRDFVVWAKRAYHFRGLMRLLLRPALLRVRGAKIGVVTAIGAAQIEGRERRLSVGDFSSLGKCQIVLHDEVRIGRCVVINDGVRILTASHEVMSERWRLVTAPISVGDYAWIAMGAIILPGVKIGVGAVVAAGAVVSRDVPDYAVAFGNPAKLRLDVRKRTLSYWPAVFNAPYEAWVGSGIGALMSGYEDVSPGSES